MSDRTKKMSGKISFEEEEMSKIEILYCKLLKNLETMKDQENSELASIILLIVPLLSFVFSEIGKDFNGYNVKFMTGGSSTPQPDFILLDRVIVEAKNISEEKKEEEKKSNFSTLNFTEGYQNKSDYHLSQAIQYLVRLYKGGKTTLKHAVVTTGKLWVVAQNVPEQLKKMGFNLKSNSPEDLSKHFKTDTPLEVIRYDITKIDQLEKLLDHLKKILKS